MVEPFSEVGMVAQISAIQSITEPYCRASCKGDLLPAHIQEILDQTWTVHNSVSWQVCCYSTRIYFWCPVRHLLVTQIQ